MDPEFNETVLRRDRRGNMETQMAVCNAETGRMRLQVGNTKDSCRPPAAGRRAWKGCVLRASGRKRPAKTLISDSGLQNSERTHFYYFEPPSLW